MRSSIVHHFVRATMHKMRPIVIITVIIVTLLQLTRSATIVPHHADPIRKSHSKLNEAHMVYSPPLSFNLLKREHAAPEPNAKTNGQKSIQGLNRRSRPSRLDRHQPSFMIISASTGGPGAHSGSDHGMDGLQAGFGGGSGAQETVSVEMMIIEFDEQPPTEKRRIPKTFGSVGPLLIEDSPMINAANEKASQSSQMTPDSESASRPAETLGDVKRELENIEKLKAMGGEGGITFANLLNFMTPASDKIKTFQPGSSSLTTQAAKPQVSLREPVATKASESISFTQAPEKQVFLGSDQTFDNKSHHSQL